jgi:two-component system sensor histidine kinase PilS (NtrC family)
MKRENAQQTYVNEYNSIRYLNLFRLFISLLFFSIIFERFGSFFGFKYSHDAARLISGLYLLFSILVWIMSVLHKSTSKRVGIYALIVDLPTVVVLALLLDGVQSGWAVLPVIIIGSFAMLSRNSLSIIMMPIAATLMLWFMPLLLGLNEERFDYSTVLLYSLTYFAIALLGMRQSQAYSRSLLVNQRQKKRISGLSSINAMIIDKMQSGVIAFDEEYKIILLNKSAAKILKTSEGRLLPPPLIKKIIAYKDTGENSLNLFGDDVLIDVVDADKKDGFRLLFIDDQNQINEKAQQTNLATIGQLSATVAHELRNPMSAIYSASQLLAESPDISEQDKELTDIISSQIERSNQIIEDILLMSKRHIPTKVSINLNDQLAKLKEDFCTQKLIDSDDFNISAMKHIVTIQFDLTMLNQVFWNLASNAIKHGEDHKVTVTVIDLKDMVFIDFKNSGPSFEPIVEESLFTPFFTTHNQGTGLGLFICREMCKANQAKLEYLRQEFQHVFRIHLKK